jgi:hypothetical protein
VEGCHRECAEFKKLFYPKFVAPLDAIEVHDSVKPVRVELYRHGCLLERADLAVRMVVEKLLAYTCPGAKAQRPFNLTILPILVKLNVTVCVVALN